MQSCDAPELFYLVSPEYYQLGPLMVTWTLMQEILKESNERHELEYSLNLLHLIKH